MDKNFSPAFRSIGIFFALCVFLAGGVWWSVRELEQLNEEYYALENERAAGLAVIARTGERNKILQQINVDNTEIISDVVEFYYQLQKILENNGVNIIATDAGENNLSLQLQGGYYSVVNFLADWRTMPFASKMSYLRIERSKSEPKFFVDVHVVFEIMTE